MKPVPVLDNWGFRSPVFIATYEIPSYPTPAPVLVEEGDDAAATVDAYALARADALGSLAGADHRRHAIFARDDRGMRHGAADVRDRRKNLAEDRRPAWIGDGADENVAFAHLADVVGARQDARDAFHHAGGSGVAPDLVRVFRIRYARPGIQRFGSDSPEHLHRRVLDAVGHRPDRGRRIPVLELLEDFLAPADERLEVRAAACFGTRRPGDHDLDQRLIHFEVLQVEDILALLDLSPARKERAEFAHLAEEARREPLLAVELVILDVRKHEVAEREHLIEGAALLVRLEERAVFLRDPAALDFEF